MRYPIKAPGGYTPQQTAQCLPPVEVKQEPQVPQAELLAQVSAGNWQA